MASVIRPIEAKSVHQIQSGQVIVDLCSVVKELVENALDADASSIEVRFKNNGLDAIEVQDNGTGISEANYENLALKHYTSKLSTYEDLMNVQTFGFRGEALSSLCALSQFSVITAQAHEAPKGKKLEFELSGKLKSTSLTPAQKGTTMVVENLFANLPVRQKELTKNIKREYGKVIGLLHAYACISTQVKFTVKNALPKARSSIVFATKDNSSTRDNIANVYGVKMLAQLIELNLKFHMPSQSTSINDEGPDPTQVVVSGHISRPVFGEGRQTPDRQLFFVNGRPCGLPQINKAINEVYKSYNVTQSPFIFADFQMDTNAYDVNVSPDKRTILLHNAAVLTDQLKTALTERFDDAEQTVPHSEAPHATLPAYRQLTISRPPSKDSEVSQSINNNNPDMGLRGRADFPETESELVDAPQNLLKQHFCNIASTRPEPDSDCDALDPEKVRAARGRRAEKIKANLARHQRSRIDEDEDGESDEQGSSNFPPHGVSPAIPVRDFNARMSEQNGYAQPETLRPGKLHGNPDKRRCDEDIGVMTTAFDTMRPRRPSPEVATITIGDKVITRLIGTSRGQQTSPHESSSSSKDKAASIFSQRLQKFDAQKSESQSSSKQDLPSDIEDDSDSDRGHRQSATEMQEHQTTEPSSEPDSPPLEKVGDEEHEEEDERVAEERRIAELIHAAEVSGAAGSNEGRKRSTQVLKGSGTRDSVVNQHAILDVSLDFLAQQAKRHTLRNTEIEDSRRSRLARQDSTKVNEEERLSLTISKADFGRMHIVGQFNLGFIIAVRHKDGKDEARARDELFIIDQHASDEKYNFERLQAETVVGNQRLVQAVALELTAVEEEIVLENETALQQNGFIIDADHSGELPVGQRCRLLSLPLSKEVTFDLKDLEELIHLLSDSHISAHSKYVPRPSKVRKMFAMRACRSSIMIGKTLSRRQMKNILDHMGNLDKPWNCPHGRPTMRHLTSLDKLEEQLWQEGDGLSSDDSDSHGRSDVDIWRTYLE